MLKAGLTVVGAVAAGLPEAKALAAAGFQVDAKGALSCFLFEKLPHGALAMYAKPPNKPAMVLLDVEPHWETVECQPAMIEGGHFVATVFRPYTAIAPPVEVTDDELEVAAKVMLEVTARRNGWTEDPEKWFADHDLPFDRVIRVGRWNIAVTVPDHLGRLALYNPGPPRGLVLFNPNAAVLVQR